MASFVEHALRRLAEHAREWVGLPLTSVPSAAVSDDDVEQFNDMRHLRNMLDEIERLCADGHPAPVLGNVHSTLLAMMLDEIDHEWPTDEAAVELERWRLGLQAQRRFSRWWLAEMKRDNNTARTAA